MNKFTDTREISRSLSRFVNQKQENRLLFIGDSHAIGMGTSLLCSLYSHFRLLHMTVNGNAVKLKKIQRVLWSEVRNPGGKSNMIVVTFQVKSQKLTVGLLRKPLLVEYISNSVEGCLHLTYDTSVMVQSMVSFQPTAVIIAAEHWFHDKLCKSENQIIN